MQKAPSQFLTSPKIARTLLALLLETACLTFFYWLAFLTFLLYRSTALSFINTSLFYVLALSPSLFLQRHSLGSSHSLPQWFPGILVLFAFLKTYGSVFRLSLGEDTIVGPFAFYLQPLILAILFQMVGFRTKLPLAATPLPFLSLLKRSLFFTGLQLFYGIIFFISTPYLFEPYLAETRHNIPLYHEYPSKSGVQFFYKELDQAERIDKQLPKILAILQSSPFFQSAKQLSLVQIPQAELRLTQGKEAQTGAYYADTGRSYYFTKPLSDRRTLEHNLYSRANPDYAVPLHELTHQMVSQYFGLYYVHFFIPQWKDEGYAEYMSAIGCYNNPQELLELLACFRVPDEKVSHPFAQGLRNSSTHDYIAALIQTKYALEHLHMNPRDFFSPFYKNRSSEEIYSWLHRESLYNSEGFS